MKLKKATQLAVIGVILHLVPEVMYFLANLNLLSWMNAETGQVNWYMNYLGILNIIGTAMLLPFFITLFKNQK
ncbi:MAG: hypothetical protein M0P47_12695 [Bacteroidales bacterium]|nr:hypothetical protein [Bacteroidales bacterium]